MSTASTPLVVAAEAAGESDIPFCLSGVQGVPVQDALAEAELTELFEVFSSITRRGRGLDKRAVSTVFINTVDTVSKRVFTWASSSRNRPPNDCHSLANLSFRDRVRRGAVALLGSACCWPTQVPLARSVVAGRQPTGTRYVERPREQPGISGAKLKDYTRALRESTT